MTTANEPRSSALNPAARDRPWHALLVTSGVIGIAQFLLTARLAGGSLLDNYPFLSSDSYDWLLGGYALSRWLEGAPPIELPFLRNPIFILITFLDYQLVGSGVFILMVTALSLFLVLACLTLTGRFLSGPWLEVALVVFFVIVSPLAFFRPFILPDLLATALMLSSSYLLIRYWQTKDLPLLIAASAVAVVSGLTQYYALVPFAIIGGWLFVTTLRTRQTNWQLGLAVLSIFVAVGGAQALWRLAVPHNRLPTQFGLLEISTGMADFYFHVWIFALGALLPAVVAVLRRWRVLIASPLAQASWLAALALLAGTFFYQWEEMRFTLPTSAMLAFALVVSVSPAERLRPSRGYRASFLISALLAAVVGLSLSPATYWRPDLRTVEFAPARTWMGRLLLAQPRDRFNLDEHCQPQAVICDSAPLPESLSPYEQLILEAFQDLAPGASNLAPP